MARAVDLSEYAPNMRGFGMHCKQTWFYVKIFMYFDFCLFVKVCTVAYWCTKLALLPSYWHHCY